MIQSNAKNVESGTRQRNDDALIAKRKIDMAKAHFTQDINGKYNGIFSFSRTVKGYEAIMEKWNALTKEERDQFGNPDGTPLKIIDEVAYLHKRCGEFTFGDSGECFHCGDYLNGSGRVVQMMQFSIHVPKIY